MFSTLLSFVLVWSSLGVASAASLMAGSAMIDITEQIIGAPLAGYNHGPRRVSTWPVPKFSKYTTFMTPSVGRAAAPKGLKDGIFIRTMCLHDGTTPMCFTTIDGVGSDLTLNAFAYDIAVTKGFTVPFENCLFSASHSHSGPGAISPDFLWAVAPATDLLVQELQRAFATAMADTMVKAVAHMTPAAVATGSVELLGVSKNRRAHESPFLNSTTIDPHLGLIRVDDVKTGHRIGTLWNFAIHGVCYGPGNMRFSGDIMGVSNLLIEQATGAPALFVNADAGDIDPADTMCNGTPLFKGSTLMADAVLSGTKAMSPVADVTLGAYTHTVDFGPTDLNATLARFSNCTKGGFLDICRICEILDCVDNVHMPSSWLTNQPRFTAFSIVPASSAAIPASWNRTVIVSMPGEPLLQLGWWVRNDTEHLYGWETTILAGYNGYFATPREYDIGGYESTLTFWGIDTALKVRDSVRGALAGLKAKYLF